MQHGKLMVNLLELNMKWILVSNEREKFIGFKASGQRRKNTLIHLG